MKSTIRTLTALLLLFAIGVVMPKIIQAGAIAAAQFERIEPAEKTENEISSSAQTEPVAKNKEVDAEKESANVGSQADMVQVIDENFPIKTAEEDSAFTEKDKNAVETPVKTVDKIQPVIKEKQIEAGAPDSKDDTVSSETIIATEEQVRSTQPANEEIPAVTITFKDVSYSRWVTAPLNMRSGPGIGYERITSIPTAELLRVSSIASNGWSQVSYNGRTGFVSGNYLSETEIRKPIPEAAPAEQKPEAQSYAPYRMYVSGKAITYRNGGVSDGQRIIDESSNLISTWGGAEIYSGTDGYNTHFIGHNPGIFKVLTTLDNGSIITVTDKNALPTSYKVTRIFTVDDYAYNAKDGVNYYNYMISRRGGEVITLQTCLGTNNNLIIRAEAIN